jgi:large subunit ribosomal protein L6
MSKIGEKPIAFSPNIKLEIKDRLVKISGPKGEQEIQLPESLTVVLNDNQVVIKRESNDRKTKALHGLYRQLINNALVGVEKMWEKRLEIVGTGYNAKLQGEDLVLKLGYSHPVVFKKIPGIVYQVIGNNQIVVAGVDRQLVGQVAYQIKMLKKPDVYKGKGIRYLGEKLRIKAGKKAKTAKGGV